VRDLSNERSRESDGKSTLTEKKQDLSGINPQQSVSVLPRTHSPISHIFAHTRTHAYRLKVSLCVSLTCEETFLRFLRSSSAAPTSEFGLTPILQDPLMLHGVLIIKSMK